MVIHTRDGSRPSAVSSVMSSPSYQPLVPKPILKEHSMKKITKPEKTESSQQLVY